MKCPACGKQTKVCGPYAAVIEGENVTRGVCSHCGSPVVSMKEFISKEDEEEDKAFAKGLEQGLKGTEEEKEYKAFTGDLKQGMEEEIAARIIADPEPETSEPIG